MLVYDKYNCVNVKPAYCGLREASLITGVNGSGIPIWCKMRRVLFEGEKFHNKFTKMKNITTTKCMSLIKGTKLNKE